ncbi:Vesicle-associated membrane protein 3 [Desmophyllum pertusum]|uniref:Vesicle-associated membrane protein 3 n=1 Tax=Desmophyllum pertusum TaxID=174260 RepID=A0A9X0CCC4_9CNID|nr:Vesicle-associated membrane protein 3 [Desmophyllum pertusum]
MGSSAGFADRGSPLQIAKMSNKRLQQTQAQVDEVVDIMKVNVDKVLERDAKLSELDSRADQLQAGASQFEHSAARLKRKMWWQNCKMWIILIVVIVVIIAAIVIWVVANQSSSPAATDAPATKAPKNVNT